MPDQKQIPCEDDRKKSNGKSNGKSGDKSNGKSGGKSNSKSIDAKFAKLARSFAK